ncbi:hypothetical protein O181_084621 [Austropuccinia psidii MF-1]|uniref:Uncharacterized protein n=1 Tax=Austropuccinia psidii MF-1 TaxID=1389203 RepID=A0A9Q3FRC4_9BASI|nr:hypothetical protein [Austropuccinia psidii MF-1]
MYGLAERMIQTLEEIIRRFCAYCLELKDYYGFSHYFFTLISELILAYNTSIHASTGKNHESLEKGCNPKLSVDTLKKDLAYIHPTASSFKLMLDKLRNHGDQRMTDSFEYAKKSGIKVIKPHIQIRGLDTTFHLDL